MQTKSKYNWLIAVLFLAMTSPTHAADLIPLGSSWKYFLGTSEASSPADAWRAVAYNDGAWPAGPAPIGYDASNNTGTAPIATVLPDPRTAGNPSWNSSYFRKSFSIANPASVTDLSLTVYTDDGAVVWLNGVEVGRINVPDGDLAYNGAALVADETRILTSANIANLLVAGNNVVAVHGFNGPAASSDFVFEAVLTATLDEAPTVFSLDPPPSAIVQGLSLINVAFTENVSGVDASDLFLDGVPAISIATNNPRDYSFTFAAPASTGTVTVAWVADPGIIDIDGLPNAFVPGVPWTYTIDPNIVAAAAIISEFMAANDNGIQDEDGTRADWLELYNPGLVDVSLDGWYLTDNATNLTKWRIPGVIIEANKYLLVWASEKDRANPAAPLHTNFRLSRNAGSYLALVNPSGIVASSFGTNVLQAGTLAPYQAQFPDVSYGRDRLDPNLTGYFITPTPDAQNSTSGTGFAPEPAISHESGVYTDAALNLVVTVPPGTTVRYTSDGSVPTSTSPAYTTTIVVQNNTTYKFRTFPAAAGLFPSAVLVRNLLFLDGTTRNFNSNIPVLILSTEGRGMSQNVPSGFPRTKGTFAVFDTFRGHSSFARKPDYIGPADFEIFGQTSAGFLKKPYNIELQDEAGNDKDVSILGLPAEADWKLRNPFSDKCMMNDFLAYELFEDMGNYSVRRRLVEVFVDTGGGRLSYPGDYVGIEVFLEKIERGNDRVDIAELAPASTVEPEITGGWMFKDDKDSAGDININVMTGGNIANTLKIHEPKPQSLRNTPSSSITTYPGSGYTPSASNQLNYLLRYLATVNTSLTGNGFELRTGTNHYSHYLDVDTFVDVHWIVEFPKQIDGYRISNFFSKDRNGKIRNVPIWDWNLSFGNANYLEGGRTNGWYYTQTGGGDHTFLRSMLGAAALPNAGGDPDFIQKVIDRWGVLRTNILNGERLLSRIDEIATMLNNGGAASSPITRNFNDKYNGPGNDSGALNTYTWPNPLGAPDHVDYSQPTYDLIIAEMKKWTMGRYLWVDAQFPKAPTLGLPEGDISAGTQLSVAAPAGTIYYTLDGTDPRASQANGAVAAGAQTYSGSILLNNNVRVFARARVGTTWSPPAIATYVVETPRLVITEIMYHPLAPAAGSPYIDEDFEYIELKNVGGSTLNLNAYNISGGIDFAFPNRVLSAGARVLVVKNQAAFNSRYPGLSAMVAGEYTGNLANDGNRLILEGRVREPILDFRYDDAWHPVTDGFGFSLVIVDENAAANTWGFASSWRASGELDGTPGQGDTTTSFPQVVVNEALSHSDPQPPTDTIELRNLSGTPANIGNWYLTDDFRNPKKYRIAPGTTIPANGYLVFNESQFNTPSNAPTSFALSSSGEEVYLFSGDADGNLTGYVHGFDFGPAPSGVTFGRHVLSTGQEDFVLETSPTLGAANSGPRVGPIVVSEIMYHPPDVLLNGGFWDNTEDEYIELQNISGASVPLYDPLNPNNTWRLRDAVDFTFPNGVTVPPGGYVLVVSFDPANTSALNAFISANGVPAGTPIYGPWSGKLDNSDESVELVYAGPPGAAGTPTAGQFTYYLADKVKYGDTAPWPVGLPDGLGAALGRVNTAAYGNDPGNWRTSPKTPGAPLPTGDIAPAIVTQPSDTAGVEGQSASFTLSATGSALGYIWTFNGNPISGASSPTLTLNNLALSQAGNYACFVFNSAGSVQSSNAVLTVNMIPRVTQQPMGVAVYIKPDSRAANLPNGTNVTFTVAASSSLPPITYQWRFNGVAIPGAVGSSYTVLDVQLEDEGDYSCVVTDSVGSAYSEPARLVPWLQPFITVRPVSQTVTEGAMVSMSVAVTGNPLPMEYEWRRGSIPIASKVSNSRTNIVTLVTDDSLLTLNPGASSTAHSMRVVIKNDAHTAPGITTTFTITVVADADRDGIADAMELALGLNPNNAADAAGDLDNDGMSNRAEAIAGTNPTNALSYLKMEQSVTPGVATLQFGSVSNRTYTIQYTDDINATAWNRLADFPAQSSNVVHQIPDPNWTTNRFYRVATPALP